MKKLKFYIETSAMKHDKLLQDVWRWKEEVYKEIKGLRGEGLINYFRQQSKSIQKKYNLRLKRVDSSISRHK